MPNYMTRIRQLREFCGLSQEAVADQLGITQSAYSRLESGTTRLDLPRLQQLAALYGLTVQQLVDLNSVALVDIISQTPAVVERLRLADIRK
ncbi:helix-turn-helix domain-containing protein [Spirosoma sordidisoli]|uniref:XRE family transcriptional regulator n=1 Tax=Spirosoma sordidisoli TaxID=2502893 RepID=A0A4Q2UIH0_9BACT|nr:helix-turn-helix transcriptional regulator [Spirosoma sordidisoli]RYC67301.1 XRE family transcriptional regulator [Spirosoma sordidisoli]